MHKTQWLLGADFDKTAFYAEVDLLVSASHGKFLTIKISDRPADINSAKAETIAIILNTAIDDAATTRAIDDFANMFFAGSLTRAISLLAATIDRQTNLNEDGNEINDALTNQNYQALYRIMVENQSSIDQIVVLSNIADNF